MKLEIFTKETTVIPKGRASVVVSANPVKTSILVDKDGNEYDRRTKMRIGKNDLK